MFLLGRRTDFPASSEPAISRLLALGARSSPTRSPAGGSVPGAARPGPAHAALDQILAASLERIAAVTQRRVASRQIQPVQHLRRHLAVFLFASSSISIRKSSASSSAQVRQRLGRLQSQRDSPRSAPDAHQAVDVSPSTVCWIRGSTSSSISAPSSEFHRAPGQLPQPFESGWSRRPRVPGRSIWLDRSRARWPSVHLSWRHSGPRTLPPARRRAREDCVSVWRSRRARMPRG